LPTVLLLPRVYREALPINAEWALVPPGPTDAPVAAHVEVVQAEHGGGAVWRANLTSSGVVSVVYNDDPSVELPAVGRVYMMELREAVES
jgi:hypothetical protein